MAANKTGVCVVISRRDTIWNIWRDKGRRQVQTIVAVVNYQLQLGLPHVQIFQYQYLNIMNSLINSCTRYCLLFGFAYCKKYNKFIVNTDTTSSSAVSVIKLSPDLELCN